MPPNWHHHRRDPHGQPYGQRRPRRLQRQLFWGFGFAIFAAMLASTFVASLLHSQPGDAASAPWKHVIAFAVAGNVLWSLSGLLARRLAWPLVELSRTARAFGTGELDARVPVPARAGSEAIELANTFNEMASRIETQVRNQKDLLGAVSHELRTPLGRMRVVLAMLQDQAVSPELVAKLEREIVEMDGLVGELLADARVGAGALTRSRIDLRSMARDACERLGLRDVTLRIDDDAANLEADPTLVARALSLLLDNAHKHGGPQITLRVSRVGDETRVEVEDNGPGFAADDLPRLFEPFARGRGADLSGRPGVGLGLYLVRRVAEAHRGQAFADNRAEGGAVVGFSLRS